MAARLSSYWEDFLLHLQPHIPSMDSDSCSGTMCCSEECEEPGSPAGAQQVTTDPSTDAAENKLLGSNPDANPKWKQREDDSCAPVLSFSLLDGWDLDDVIRTLQQNGPEGDNRSPGDDIILERLVSFSEQQAASRLTSEPAAPEPEPVQSAAYSGERRNRDEAIAAEEMSRQECPTVYIDLRRGAGPSGKTPTATMCRRVSADSETAAKHSRRRRQGRPPETGVGHGGQRDGSRARSGGETGMSMLLRKMRELNKRGDGGFKEPSLKLESDVLNKELPGKPTEPADPTWRQESLGSHAGGEPPSAQRGSKKTATQTTETSDVVLLVSPAVAPRCWGLVLSECLQRGFALSGLQRLQLHSKAARAFGLTGSQALLFCKSPNATPGGKKTTLSSHCLALLLKTESATRHWTGLPAGTKIKSFSENTSDIDFVTEIALMGEFEAQGLNGVGVNAAEPSSCFHVSLYTDNLRRCAARGDADAVLSGVRRPSSDPQDEDEEGQVVILSLCGRDLRQGLALLHRLLGGAPGDDGGGGEGGADEGEKGGGGGGGGGFELLDLTWLPALTGRQARELSPYEVGEELWPRSLGSLTAAPALVCALRRAEAFAALRRFLPRGRHRDAGRLDALMSPTPELAFRQAQLFFSQGEAVPAAGGFTSHRSTSCS
ncbi:hypothetical protein N1851_008385 [Merluccius polli]|uniref:Uncharacterized protein n=1 Tax=Merluccius polli TaxID=89951 RepID=A0AA47N2K0_MERPO|nr:hypothetical protein N1851_008385 [Merluccius polli]